MFVTQVIFSSDIENKEEINKVKEIKKEQLTHENGPVRGKILDLVSDSKAGFALIAKWNNEEDFKTWLKEIHKDKNEKHHENSKKFNIEKTKYQFIEE